MNTFVIVFRRSSPALTGSARQRLNEETAAWAKVHNANGHKLEPRILTAETERRGPDVSPVAQPEGGSLSALLFLEARDLNEAAQIAASHPGLNCGFNVEVRPWTTPGAAAPSTQPAVAT